MLTVTQAWRQLKEGRVPDGGGHLVRLSAPRKVGALLGRGLGLRAAAWVLGPPSRRGERRVQGAPREHAGGDRPEHAGPPEQPLVYATAFFGSLGWLAWRRRQREAVAVCAFAILAMGPARVLSGAHVVSDCLGGYLFGAGWLLALAAAFGRTRRGLPLAGSP